MIAERADGPRNAIMTPFEPNKKHPTWLEITEERGVPYFRLAWVRPRDLAPPIRDRRIKLLYLRLASLS